MEEMHSLLKRQLKKCFGASFEVPDQWTSFVEAVDTAYKEFDTDRTMLERSLDLSSQELLQANSEMRALFQAIPDPLFRLGVDGTILECRAGGMTDLFFATDKFIGKRIQDVLPGNAGSRFAEAAKFVRDTKSMTSFEYSLKMHDQVTYYEARILPLLETQIFAIIRNITNRKKAEEELLKSSKLESIGILAGGIAHDFNNILTAVMGNISLAKNKMDPESAIYKRLSEAEKASLRAQDLTQQLLTFSKGGAPIRKVASIGEILTESARFIMRGSNVRCDFFIPDDLAPVDIDEGQISQVINNLVINALQSMTGGGTITITAVNETVGGQTGLRHLPLKDGQYIKITIRDQGTGIPEDQLDKIFDPYFTTKQHGTGLGLTTTYAIVKKHDGHISVESKPGGGTIFSIYLPASKDKLNAKGVAEKHPAKGFGKVLLMDDEEIIRDVAGSMLLHLGYNVESAKDGNEAIELVRKAAASGSPFDVIIMDLTIPGGMGGKDAVRQILAITPRVRAIASSGYSNDPIMSEFREYGFSAIVPKPYKIDDLQNAIEQVMSVDREPGARMSPGKAGQ